MAELISMTYEQSRAEHFKELMKKEQRKIDWWQARENKLRPLDMASRSHIECSEAGMRYNYYNDALEALENQPKWISVEERLPQESDVYLTYSSYGRKVLAYHSKCKTWGSVWIGEFDVPVTHWMPLPEPPKEV